MTLEELDKDNKNSWANPDPMKCDFSTKDSDKFKITESPKAMKIVAVEEKE